MTKFYSFLLPKYHITSEAVIEELKMLTALLLKTL